MSVSVPLAMHRFLGHGMDEVGHIRRVGVLQGNFT